MTVRTISAWLSSVGVMLAAGAMSAGGACGQDSFPAVGFRPMLWPAPPAVGGSPSPSVTGGTRGGCSPQGCGVTETWSPKPGASDPIRSGVQRVFGAARPTYQVNPLPMSRSRPTVPSANRESPFYEYREAPARVRVRPQPPVSPIERSESPFYP